jgi:hypothetical protein
MKNQSGNKTINRETWLNKAARLLVEKHFNPLGLNVPDFKVSIGFTGSRSQRAIGVCWRASVSSDNKAQIMIVPTIDDSMRILDILIHEMIHVIYPDDGHGSKFGKAARALGLEGKLTATVASEELKRRLKLIVAVLGEIPHSALGSGKLPKTEEGKPVPRGSVPRPIGSGKKQSTRMHKVECQSCGYTVRISNKWIQKGLPTCVCGCSMEAATAA